MSRPPEHKSSAKAVRPPRTAEVVARHAPQEVRLMGGKFKRTPLSVPTWPGLRPTPARVRETLFNWLGQDLSGWRVLDAFAGTGALGLEAASRGAQDVVLLERESTLVKHLQSTVARLKAEGVSVQRDDALGWMTRCARQHPAGRFDLVLLDPPFEADLFDQALALAAQCVPAGGWIYLEAPHAYGLQGLPAPLHNLPDGLKLHRQGKAGAVHYHLIQRMGADALVPAAEV